MSTWGSSILLRGEAVLSSDMSTHVTAPATGQTTMNDNIHLNDIIGPQLGRLQRGALLAAVLGLILCIGQIAIDLASPTSRTFRFFESYLFAYMFWFGVTLGSLAMLMLHHVTGGGWGFLVRRPLEAATRNLPLILAMFVPIVIAMLIDPHLYRWAHLNATGVTEDFAHHVIKKSPYLNATGFIIRAVIYFAIWMTLAFFLNKWGAQQDEREDEGNALRLGRLSAPGLLIYVLTLTFASIDWVMSLTPTWTSSLFGVIFLAGQILSTLALMAVLVSTLAGHTDLVKRVEPRYFRDLGNLMLAFTLFWAYTSFSQYLIIWAGNIADESEWFVLHLRGSWLYVGALLCFAHFFFPFLCLLSSSMKVKLENLAKLGVFIIFMRHVDLWWYVTATFRQEGASMFQISDLGAPLLLGGLWLWSWARELKGREAVPVHDPRLKPFWPLKEIATHG